MKSATDLDFLLQNLKPSILDDDFVFCNLGHELEKGLHLNPIACFHENEGWTMVITMKSALANKLVYESTFRCITLNVESSLNAVGLTATVAQALADKHISANVIAAYYHDHIFVPSNRAEDALVILKDLSDQCAT
ncbi:ACT domain-containing protein [Bermanella marisrubri]|uniref:DUF2241 domain-containing protein n=1 Tax=Bermanella marisrubri TaxID=207949 RepID=Q1MXM7_9GAMM|nr:ACT domain-containing protein [Bermanella marisrubri]EAT10728.1 hypothetical protein RED65_07449 [Oceanobacter sp. RED65] [Bermanella marisrubri]QIZ84734.1 ACT domain-containing protein [Bermanella marisrubri]